MRRPAPARRQWRPPPRIASEAGSSLGIAAWRLVQNSTVSRPGIGGIAAVLPLAITTARRAMSCSPPTATVRRSVSVPSPRKSLAPVASIAAAGRLSSRLRAIHSTRLETLGKSTVHSTREAARSTSAIGLAQRFARAKQASWKARSPSTGTRRRPALARQPRASARCPEGPPRSLLRRRHHRDTRRQTPGTTFRTSVTHHRRRPRYEGCSPDAQSSIRPWYRSGSAPR